MDATQRNMHTLLLLHLIVLGFTTGSAYFYRHKLKQWTGTICHHCVYHYATKSYEQCRHPTAVGGTAGHQPCLGRCYVRMDPNGYVYRGCASQAIFPGINEYHQAACSQQGHPNALWWFCDGSLCNMIDLVAHCRDPLYPSLKSFNICDGHCRDPTGSYPDPHNSTFRIQCGFALMGGQPCQCCKQYYLKCPGLTHWDDEIKQCIEGRKSVVRGQGYTYGFH